MRRDTITTMVDKHIAEAGGDESKGLQTFRSQMSEVIETQKVTLENVSLSALFESMCNRDHSVDKTDAVGIAEAMTGAGMPTLIGELIHPVAIQEYEPLTTEVLQLVMQVDSTTDTEKIGGLSAHDQLDYIRELEPYPESQPVEKYVEIDNAKFGRKISLSVEAVMFDRTGQIVAKAKDLGRKMGTHLHKMIIQRVCDYACSATGAAVNTSLKINGSTRDMFHADHSWDTNANPNLGSSTLGTAGLVTILAMWAAIYDEKGDELLVMPKFIVVPLALEATARQIVGSDFQYDTANRALNIFKNKYTVVASPIIDASGSATTWFIGDFPAQNRLQWVWHPRTDSLANNTQRAFDIDIVAQYKISYMAGVGATDYRFVIQGNS